MQDKLHFDLLIMSRFICIKCSDSGESVHLLLLKHGFGAVCSNIAASLFWPMEAGVKTDLTHMTFSCIVTWRTVSWAKLTVKFDEKEEKKKEEKNFL